MKRFLILYFLLFNFIYASTNLLKQSEIFIDNKGSYTINTISNAAFKKMETSKLHLGYTNSTVWLKFNIENKSDISIEKVLVVDNSILDSITLFTKNQNGYIVQTKGVLHLHNKKEPLMNFFFNISLDPKEIKQYYLQVSSKSSALYFDPKLMEAKELYTKEIKTQIVLSLFFGAMATLILYNLVIYFFTKEYAYLYYVLYMFFTTWTHASYTSYNLHILKYMPEKLIDAEVYFSIYYLIFTMIFVIFFLRSFLNLSLYKKIDTSLKVSLAIFIIFLPFAGKDFYAIELFNYFALLFAFYVIGFTYYLYIKKEPNAKYIFWGWSFSIAGWIMLSTKQLGYYSIIEHFPYFYELMIFLEGVLFAIALSNKLNKTKELELEVDKNAVLTKELHHRVKNNMQFIISMYRLKLSKFLNPELKTALSETEGSIQAISDIHEMLYAQNNLQTIDTKQYFNTLIQRLSKIYDTLNIKIELDIHTSLELKKSETLGIILNELFTNTFKYAFEDNKGFIKISLKRSKNKYTLIYSDNGKGFDPQKNKNSFGLRLIKNLVKDELKGEMLCDSSKGASYTIIWQ